MEIPSEVPSAPTIILPNYVIELMKLAQEEDPVIKSDSFTEITRMP